MQYYERYLKLTQVQRKSLFLFGPRQTGKSSLIKRLFPNSKVYNLLLSEVFTLLKRSPKTFREEVMALKADGPIIVDEIQMIPDLLNEIHYLIEETDHKFILTGSSARKLKRGASNLLGGRALEYHFYPLTFQELGGDFDIVKAVNIGTLPFIYLSAEPELDLNSYVSTYLHQEIFQEGLTRSLEPFAKFLEIAAVVNTEQLNFEKVASDVGLSAKTIKEYFRILSDTLLGEVLRPYTKTKKRKAQTTAKFYFFDVGVANFLARRKAIQPKSELFGKVFEHFIYTELRSYLQYTQDLRELTFWRSQSKQEVDFILGDDIAIEVKGTDHVHLRHLKGLRALGEEVNLKKKMVVSLDPRKRVIEKDFWVYPYQDFLCELWAGELA